MKNLLVILLFFSTHLLLGQQKAITDTGKEVVLYNDGTWAYAGNDTLVTENIPVNPHPFTKPKGSGILLKSEKIDIGCYLNPKKWEYIKAVSHDDAEYNIDHKELDIYALLLTETLNVSLESLANIAIDNARDAAPDLKVTAKEYRKVNGLDVLMMRMTGTIYDIQFGYYGYYFVMDGAAVQFLVYSSVETIEEQIPEIEDLLNGLVMTAR